VTFIALWRYRVDESDRAAFERAYGPDGDWARLFGREPGYLGTELLRGECGDYLTLDRWQDETAWLRFKDRHASDYEELDSACEVRTVEEQRLGSYSTTNGSSTPQRE
jgi:heme-degrading monooxygenase HmoA